MSNSNHQGTGDAPQNQNNAMSDDPGDGNRNAFSIGRQGPGKAAGGPDEQGEEQLEEFGRRGSKQD